MSVLGDFGCKVAVEVRGDGSMRLRWYSNCKKIRFTLDGLAYRDRRGDIRLHDVQAAERLALRASQAIARGQDPLDELTRERPAQVSTIPAGSLGPICTAFLEDMETAISKDSLVNYRGMVATLRIQLGDAFPLESLTVLHVDQVSRALALQHVHGDGSGGPVQCEKTLSLAFRIGRWAGERNLVTRVPVRPSRLKRRVWAIWATIVGRRHRPARPSSTSEEASTLLRALGDGDPRLALMLEAFFGARLGQIRSLRRTDLDMRSEGWSRGTAEVPDGGERKLGFKLDLVDRTFEAFQRAFGSWLRPYEEAFQCRLIDDYPLFPSGAASKLPLLDPMVPRDALTEAYLGELYDELELAAGIEKVPGRRWYGLRRLFRNLAAGLEKDTRVLDKLFGHNTRGIGGVYENDDDLSVRKRCMEVREEIWRLLSTPTQLEK